MQKLLFPLLAPLLLVPNAFAADPISNTLPLRDVALFSSGVGYFGRAGQIDGETTLPLSVHAPQIPDLLKSLVLFDPKGGVRPVTYSLRDYVSSRAQETDLQLGAAASPGALLQAFQGARVRLEKSSGAIEGLILSVSSRQIKVDESFISVEHLSLLTKLGVQTVRLDDVTSFRLLDANLDAKLRATLEKKALALTQKLDDGARSVQLNFAGRGRREVRAAYLLETPAWKTSYRLVLDSKKKPYLQGWAVVENTTDEDWKQVRLSLISGRPISFIQDLATPVYVARPVVAPFVIGSARPQTFGEGFSPDADENRITALESRPMSPAPQSSASSSFARDDGLKKVARRAAPAARPRMESEIMNEPVNGMLVQSDELQQSTESQAQGAERGELFEYAIDGATSVKRGHAALVPIVSGDIGGEAVSIVESSLQKGEIPASNGFLLRNSSGLHLQGGPITVFAGGIYAGDALVSNLSPNDSRLIAYARDLELVATQSEPEYEGRITKLRVVDGVLHIRRSAELTRRWNFKNKSSSTKPVLLQVPDEPNWKLADPKRLGEKTANAQRFRFLVTPGDSKTTLVWESQQEETYGVFDLSRDDLLAYVAEKSISPALKAKLSEVAAQKSKLATLAAQRALQEATVRDIEADQKRIRSNMEPLDKSGKLFKSYEAKLGAQESRIERAREEIARLRESENSARASLKNSLAKLDLE